MRKEMGSDSARRSGKGPQPSHIVKPLISEGAQFQIPYPFKREEYTSYDEDGRSRAATWNPGWRREDSGPEDTAPAWDGEGLEIRSIVSTHKPGRFPARVFYTRQWRDPSGKTFGKTALRMTTEVAFKKWMRGGLLARLAYERDHPGRAYGLAMFARALSEREAVVPHAAPRPGMNQKVPS